MTGVVPLWNMFFLEIVSTEHGEDWEGIRQLLALIRSVHCDRWRSLMWEATANLQILLPPVVRGWNHILGVSLHLLLFSLPWILLEIMHRAAWTFELSCYGCSSILV